MAPHWKCGSGQPVAGSNPALSANYARHDRGRSLRWPVRPLAHGRWGPLARDTPGRLAIDHARDALAATDISASITCNPSGGVRQRTIGRALLSFRSRARRGTSGALNLQSAIAGLNPLPRSPSPNAARRRDVEDRVPRSGEPRTVSGPEGSSTKRSSSGAAERPGPSRSSWWARERPGRRRVHGISNPRVRRERRRS